MLQLCSSLTAPSLSLLVSIFRCDPLWQLTDLEEGILYPPSIVRVALGQNGPPRPIELIIRACDR